jgi:hypothetical protein
MRGSRRLGEAFGPLSVDVKNRDQSGIRCVFDGAGVSVTGPSSAKNGDTKIHNMQVRSVTLNRNVTPA